MAETNFGDVVIENQFGSSDYCHLGQLGQLVTRRESRVVITNVRRRWAGALDVLAASREQIDRDFSAADLPKGPRMGRTGGCGPMGDPLHGCRRLRRRIRRGEDPRTQPGRGGNEAKFDLHVQGVAPRLEEDSSGRLQQCSWLQALRGGVKVLCQRGGAMLRLLCVSRS